MKNEINCMHPIFVWTRNHMFHRFFSFIDCSSIRLHLQRAWKHASPVNIRVYNFIYNFHDNKNTNKDKL